MDKELTIKIKHINDVDAKEWDDFLKKTPESTFFCTTDWWRSFNRSYILQIRNNKNELVAGVPFRFFSVLPLVSRFFMFSWLDSSVLVDNSYNEKDTFSLKKKALTFLLKHLKKTNAILIFISPKVRSRDEKLFKEVLGSSEKCATFIVDVTLGEDEIFSSFSNRRKRSIRKSEKKGVEIVTKQGKTGIPLISDFYLLEKKLFKHKNSYYSSVYIKPRSHLRSVLQSDRAFISIAYYNGQPVAGSVFFTNKDTVTSYPPNMKIQLMNVFGTIDNATLRQLQHLGIDVDSVLFEKNESTIEIKVGKDC